MWQAWADGNNYMWPHYSCGNRNGCKKLNLRAPRVRNVDISSFFIVYFALIKLRLKFE